MSSSSIYLKKPKTNVSNWFSSLKRQGKSKKAADKLMPKSCVDLTANSLYKADSTDLLTDSSKPHSNSTICCCECGAVDTKSKSPTPTVLSTSSSTSSSGIIN